MSGLARPQTPGSVADNPSFQHQDMIVSGIKPTSASTIAGPATDPTSNKLLRPAASMTDDSRYAPSNFIQFYFPPLYLSPLMGFLSLQGAL